MINERKILAAILQDRDAWVRLAPHLDDLAPDTRVIYDLASGYYGLDPGAKVCDVEVIKGQISRKINSNKLAEALCRIIDDLPAVSSSNITKELLEIKKHSVGLKIVSELTASRHGPELDNLIETFKRLQGDMLDVDLTLSGVEPICGVDIRTLVAAATDQTKLIRVLPDIFNERLDGGLTRGHHLMVFARPEIGKTLFWVNMVAGFLSQKLRVLAVCNEEPQEDVLLRLGSRVSGMNKYEIRDNPDKAHELITERCGELFTIVSLAPGNFEQINGLTEKYEPDIVVIDQLRNIDMRCDNPVQSKEKASNAARALAKTRNVLTVSITQAGDSGDGKRVLQMGDIEGSNTGMQGPTDVILGIGATEDDKQRNIRFGTPCKNKRGVPGGHEPFQFFVDPSISKVYT